MAKTPPSEFLRAAGILVHPSSLPGRFGMGDLGPAAYRFVDWLASAGMSLWQILPLAPHRPSGSPYSGWSAFGGNPLLVDLVALCEHGLLDAADLNSPPFPLDAVDFEAVQAFKTPLLDRAAARLLSNPAHPLAAELRAFRERQAWFEDAALFAALHARHNETPWWQWPAALRDREPKALAAAGDELRDAVERSATIQFFFARQWERLRTHCHERGIRIIGDMPIYVSADSADVWANREIFRLDAEGMPVAVSGVPPDAFSEHGQRWGNPLYDWEKLARDDYGWWALRVRHAFEQTDFVRIDHFRGFAAYWEVPAHAPDARTGKWRKGPGLALFTTLKRALGELPLIAEDLGMIDEPVHVLRHKAGFPGMRVLQFAFGAKADNHHLPHNHSKDSVVYTGTHDNDTTMGWWQAASEHVREHARRYLGVSGTDPAWDLIRATMASVGDMAIIPMQDPLRLGTDARMNNPAEAQGNWHWRVREEAFNPDVAGRLRELAALYGRLQT